MASQIKFTEDGRGMSKHHIFSVFVCTLLLAAALGVAAQKTTAPDYRKFDARRQDIPKDPAVVMGLEIEPLIRSMAAKLANGTEAPDFELPVLDVKENDKGEKIGVVGKKTIRLSDFRGHKPVALTLSGST